MSTYLQRIIPQFRFQVLIFANDKPCLNATMTIANSFFEAFYTKNYNKAVRYARSIVFDQDEAQKIACDAMQRIWTLRNEIDHQKLIEHILILTIRENCIEHNQSKRVNSQVECVSDMLKDSKDLTSYLSHDLVSYVNLLKNSLHPETYDCFTKVRLEGKKIQDVADELQVSTEDIEKELRKTSWEMHTLLRTYNEMVV